MKKRKAKIAESHHRKTQRPKEENFPTNFEPSMRAKEQEETLKKKLFERFDEAV